MSPEAVDVEVAEIRKQMSDRGVQELQGVAGCPDRRNVGVAHPSFIPCRFLLAGVRRHLASPFRRPWRSARF